MNEYIKTPTVITISAANGSGKTNLIRYIIDTMKFDCIVILSNTANFSGDFDKYKSSNFFIISLVYFEEVIKFLLRKQKDIVQKGLKSSVLLCFDDILGAIKDNKLLKTLISQQRHFNITVIFSVQHINQAATYLREISTYDIIFELKTHNSLKAAYDNYFCSDYETFNDFKKNIKLARYHFILCDKINNTKKIMIAPYINPK